MELEIVWLKAPGIGEALARGLVAQIQRIRGLDLRKAPSIGETLDWAQALVVLGAPSLSRELIEETRCVVIKYDGDAAKVRRALAVDAGEAEPGGHTHSHSHSHSHSHTHTHSHGHSRQRRHGTLGMTSPADFENSTLGPSRADLAASRLASPQTMRFTAPTTAAVA